jgi:hypothetical protein
MADITITFADNLVPRIRDAIAGNYDYQDKLPDGTDNPENKTQFMRRKIKEFLKETLRAWETREVIQIAQANKSAALDVELTGE